MARELKTAEEIQAEVHRLIHDGEDVRADGVAIGVPLPTPLAPGEQGDEGSNWVMGFFRGARGYEGWIAHIVKSVQARWDLQA